MKNEIEVAKSLVPVVGRAIIPVVRYSDKGQEIGVAYAADLGGVPVSGELLVFIPGGSVGSDNAALPKVVEPMQVGLMLRNLREQVDLLFQSVPLGAVAVNDGPVELPKKPAAAPAPVVDIKPAAVARPAVQPSGDVTATAEVPAQTEVQKRRGRPPGSKNQTPPPAPVAQPAVQHDPDPEPGEASGGEPGGSDDANSEPGEPVGSSGRTYSELMALRVNVGKQTGAIFGKTYAQLEEMGKLPTTKTNLDTVLKWITTYQFKPGDGMHGADLKEQVQNAFELMELRTKLGLFAPK